MCEYASCVTWCAQIRSSAVVHEYSSICMYACVYVYTYRPIVSAYELRIHALEKREKNIQEYIYSYICMHTERLLQTWLYPEKYATENTHNNTYIHTYMHACMHAYRASLADLAVP